MSNSHIIATRKMPVFMAHICSNCGFPMITVVQIESQASTTCYLSQSRAEEIANYAADHAIQQGIQAIEDCYRTKHCPDFFSKGTGKSGLSWTSSIIGFSNSCPQCQHLELWKKQITWDDNGKLNKDNYPIVFLDEDRAEKWAIIQIKNIIADIYKERKEEDNVKKAIEYVTSIIPQIKRVEEMLQSIPEKTTLVEIKKTLSSKCSIKSDLGILDFKNKKRMDLEIDEIRAQIKSIEKTIAAKEDPFKKERITLKCQLLKYQAIAFGCSEKIDSISMGRSMTYLFKPYAIPSELSEKINSIRLPLSNQTTDSECKPVCNVDAKLKYCRKCGVKLLPDSNFCSNCGFFVREEDDERNKV